MQVKYSEEFREQAVKKTIQRAGRTIEEMADELSVNPFTLKNWLNRYRPDMIPTNTAEKRPADWTNEERLHA